MGDPHQSEGVFGRLRRRRSRNEASASSLQAGTERPYRVDPGQPGASQAPQARIPELDALRGLACLTILVYHAKTTIVPFGWASVDLFFVLSGYLITSILIRYQGSTHLLRNFYIRRGLRIWPIYYLTVLALVALGPFLPAVTSWDGLLYYLTYTQNTPLYWSGALPKFSPYAAHLWTLANEEQFYIIWPLLVCALGKRSVIPLSLALAGVSVWARSRNYDSWLLLARADGFAMGGLLAAILADRPVTAENRPAYRRGFSVAIACSLAFVAYVVARGWLPTFGKPPKGAAFSVLAINVAFLGVVGLIVAHAGRPALAWLRRPRLVGIGTISYGLYLYHFIALMLGADILTIVRGRGRSPMTDLALMGLSYVMAVASWRWIEEPCLRLKDRFMYDARGPKATEPARANALATAKPK
ncbi:acyltransferase family protein [Singulisphaera sp. PoT]|uniref:acyltransferase family protein n=1 Tax=Singulisphaera sp. PoT TaxID=3411797 RepID=UPI003BF55E5D